MNPQIKIAVFSGIGLLIVQSGIAFAESKIIEKEKVATLGDITVTANKIEENVQNVPQSISVFDEVIIEEKGIANIIDITRKVPNLSLAEGGEPHMNFRGLNTSIFTDANPVVLYIDGVAIVNRFGYDASFVDAQRVEVLRGPQGTLYGKDAIGGIINIISKDPENDWHGRVGVEYGSYDFIRGVFNASGALIENILYAGISSQYAGSDGWVENTHNGRDDEAAADESHRFNGFFLYTPTNRLRVRFTMAHDYSDKKHMDGYGLPGIVEGDDFSRSTAEKVNFDMPTEVEIKSFSQNLNIEYDFGGAMLTSVTSHRHMDFDGTYDADYSNSPLYASLSMFNFFEEEGWSEELRLASSNKKDIRWVGGLYCDTQTNERGPFGMQFPSFDMTSYDFLGNFEMNAEPDLTSHTYAVFGQVNIPFWQRLELTLGARYQHIEREIDINTYYLPVGMKGMPMYSLDADKSWDAFVPKAALSYAFSDAWRTYFSFSQGYMPGGFNNFASSGSADANSFNPQRSTNYEFGIKGKSDRLRLSAALFYMDIEDIHIYKAGPGGAFLTDNADSAHSYGVEMDFSYWLTDNIEMNGAAGLIEAEYDDYDAGGGIRYDGERIHDTPSYSLNLGVAYFHPTGFYSRATIRSQGSVNFFDSIHQRMVEEEGYTTIDARLGWQFDDWDVYLYGKNLADEEYIDFLQYSATTTLAYFGAPRTIGLGVVYRF